MDEPASAAWLSAKDALVEATGAALMVDLNPPQRPQHLFHFTDLRGMVGILETRTLWATLATALTDQSEVSYGLGRARQLIQRGGAPGDAAFLRTIERFLDPQNSPGAFRLEWRTFIISFCARADLALQWLHYGRAGSGVALAFDANRIQKKPFDLVQVLYDEGRQDLLIRSIITAASDCIQQHVGGLSQSEVQGLEAVAAHLTAQRIWMAAPRLKSHAFSDEREWRLITYDLIGARVPGTPDSQLPTRYRIVARRVVPYLELGYETLPVAEVILGADVSMQPQDPGLTMLIENTKAGMPITQSQVPVRE
jgi:hypothetical protein